MGLLLLNTEKQRKLYCEQVKLSLSFLLTSHPIYALRFIASRCYYLPNTLILPSKSINLYSVIE